MRVAMVDTLPTPIVEAIIALSKNCRRNPGGESGAQALLDGFQHYGEWAVKQCTYYLMQDNLNRWHGIKAAKAKKLLRNWSVSIT